MDPIAILFEATRAAAALVLLFVLPGLTLGPVVAPGASTQLARLGRAVGVSLVVTAFAGMMLARLGLLRPTILIALLVGLTLLPLHSRLPRRPRRPSRHARRWWLGAAAGAVLAALLAVLATWSQAGGVPVPSGATSWVDAALAWSTADTGGFRADLPAWGVVGPFRVDHGPLTAHSAAVFLLMQSDPLVELNFYRLAVLMSGLVLATLLFRRWVSTWIALLGAILLFRTVWIVAAAAGYGPEGWGLVVALFGLWLTDRAVVERSRRLAVAATASGAVVFLVDIEVFLVFAAAVAGIVIARAFVQPGGGPESAGGLGYRHGRRVGLRSPIAIDVVRPLALGAAIVGGGLLVGVVGDAVLTGDNRIVGYLIAGQSGGETVPIPLVGDPPAGWKASGDPTWDFHVAATDVGQFGQPPPAAFVDGRLLPSSAVNIWPWVDGLALLGLIVLAALLAIPLGGWPFADARRQRAILGWTAFAAVLLAGSVALFSLIPTFVPRRVGPSGLVPFIAIVPAVAAIIGLWWLNRLMVPRLRARLWRGAMPVAGAVLAAVTAVVVIPVPSTQDSAGDRQPVLSPTGYEAYRWIGNNLRPGTRVLANAWTDGAFGALAKQPGIIDGPAPYLDDPALLARATGLVLDARRVFADPEGADAAAYLAREGVQYLLVVTPAGTGDDLGGSVPFEVDLAALERSPRYRLEQRFGDGRLLLFEVVG
ncbi:MAG: hypothetical protein WEF51_00065 [Chloroflexota bacterium]